MSITLQVAAKVAGSKRPLFTDWRVPITPDSAGGRLTLRDLISRIVASEVDAFKERQAQRRLTPLLSAAQIAEGAARGKIEASDRDTIIEVDAQTAIATALLAFEDGLYFVFIDDVQQTDLDQTVFVSDETRVLFVRLVALTGA